jgi:GNAT superfamily N-acetyltransferase
VPQCAARSKRSGERCKRTASAGASTCLYHRPAAGQVRRAAARRVADAESEGVARTSGRTAFTTKELSKRTCDDFETLFAEGTGWGRCGCLFALQVRRSTRGGTWAEQRAVNLCTMRGLVEHGRSQGVLVYEDGSPVGWCQFVPKDELRFADVAASGAAWFVTCFVIDPRYRGLGATGVALRAAVKAISRKGGGIVEGHATAIAPGPPPKPERKGRHREGDVLFYGGSAKVRFAVEVDGVGPVTALYRSRRSMHGAPLGGTVDLFRREGFEAVAVLPRPTSGRAALIQPDRIVMRRTI